MHSADQPGQSRRTCSHGVNYLLQSHWEQRKKVLKKRQLEEETHNKELLSKSLGTPVEYGKYVYLMHSESGYFCSVVYSMNNENKCRIKLTKNPTHSSVFTFQSIHKTRGGSNVIQVRDQFKLMHENSKTYLAISEVSNRNTKNDDRTVFEYDLTNLYPDDTLQVSLGSQPKLWMMNCLEKWNSNKSSSKVVCSNQLVRIYFPNYDTYFCADYSYEVQTPNQGEKDLESVYADGYRGETGEEKVKPKYIWMFKTSKLRGRLLLII